MNSEKMYSLTNWKQAPSPNYDINIDREFPYSEAPFLGEYKLVKLPLSLNDLINHVDYWGEGEIETESGISGFKNCYNVNHAYKLVSNGRDKNRKIPNRIPVFSDTNCDTSAYIRDNSVVLVTITSKLMNSSCAADIARMINNDVGTVIAYEFDSDSKEIEFLSTALKQKSFYRYPFNQLPTELKGLTLNNSHIAFLNKAVIQDELYKIIVNDNFDDAVNLTKLIDCEGKQAILNDVVQKLLHADTNTAEKVISFAYKLWNSGAKDDVLYYFPAPINLLISRGNVKIINQGYNQALKLDVSLDSIDDRLAMSDTQDKTSRKVCWQFMPFWSTNKVIFKLYNVDYDMYLKLAIDPNTAGDRQAWGSKNFDNKRRSYYVEPCVKDGVLLFYIINSDYKQGLKLGTVIGNQQDRLLMGHNGDIYKDESRFRWIIEDMGENW